MNTVPDYISPEIGIPLTLIGFAIYAVMVFKERRADRKAELNK